MSTMLVDRMIRKARIKIDKLLGFDYYTVPDVKSLGFDESIISKCSPSTSRQTLKALREAGVNSKSRLIDIGCGKCALMQQISKHFKCINVDGIEISKQLVEIGRKNLLKEGVIGSEVFLGDARFFEGYDRYDYFYMYNPCCKDMTEKIIDKILAARKRGTLIYNNPVSRQYCMEKMFLSTTLPGRYGNTIDIYKWGS